MNKAQNLSDPESCLNKAGDEEPIFVLRAKDPIAPMVVHIWASLSEQLEAHEIDKTRRAHQEATEMQQWRERMYGPAKHDFGV